MNRENAETYGLAAVGAIGGVYKYYVKPQLTARRAWLGIAAAVTAYEFLCPEGELLSEGADRAIDKHPVLVPLAIGVVALHLANVLPAHIDPLHQFMKVAKGHRRY